VLPIPACRRSKTAMLRPESRRCHAVNAPLMPAPDAIVVVPRCEGSRQPLCAIYRREFAAAAEDALRAGRYRIDSLFESVRTRVIEQAELEKAGFASNIFRNLNTPEELEAGKRRA